MTDAEVLHDEQLRVFAIAQAERALSAQPGRIARASLRGLAVVVSQIEIPGMRTQLAGLCSGHWKKKDDPFWAIVYENLDQPNLFWKSFIAHLMYRWAIAREEERC